MVETVALPVGLYLTDLVTVKREIQIPTLDTSADDYLSELIAEATDTIHKWAGRPLYRAQYRERRRGTSSPYLLLSRHPVVSVASVTDLYGTVYTDYGVD